MSELEHIDLVSIHSLLTTEALAGTGRSSLTREGEARIAAADVIFAHDTDTGLGLEAMTGPCTVLRVAMDRDSNELEHLAAAIVLVKGECDAVDDEG